METVQCANCQALQRRVHNLQAENERLRRQLDASLRAGKRQAGPVAMSSTIVSTWTDRAADALRLNLLQNRSEVDGASARESGCWLRPCSPGARLQDRLESA